MSCGKTRIMMQRPTFLQVPSSQSLSSATSGSYTSRRTFTTSATTPEHECPSLFRGHTSDAGASSSPLPDAASSVLGLDLGLGVVSLSNSSVILGNCEEPCLYRDHVQSWKDGSFLDYTPIRNSGRIKAKATNSSVRGINFPRPPLRRKSNQWRVPSLPQHRNVPTAATPALTPTYALEEIFPPLPPLLTMDQVFDRVARLQPAVSPPSDSIRGTLTTQEHDSDLRTLCGTPVVEFKVHPTFGSPGQDYWPNLPIDTTDRHAGDERPSPRQQFIRQLMNIDPFCNPDEDEDDDQDQNTHTSNVPIVEPLPTGLGRSPWILKTTSRLFRFSPRTPGSSRSPDEQLKKLQQRMKLEPRRRGRVQPQGFLLEYSQRPGAFRFKKPSAVRDIPPLLSAQTTTLPQFDVSLPRTNSLSRTASAEVDGFLKVIAVAPVAPAATKLSITATGPPTLDCSPQDGKGAREVALEVLGLSLPPPTIPFAFTPALDDDPEYFPECLWVESPQQNQVTAASSSHRPRPITPLPSIRDALSLSYRFSKNRTVKQLVEDISRVPARIKLGKEVDSTLAEDLKIQREKMEAAGPPPRRVRKNFNPYAPEEPPKPLWPIPEAIIAYQDAVATRYIEEQTSGTPSNLTIQLRPKPSARAAFLAELKAEFRTEMAEESDGAVFDDDEDDEFDE